MMEEGSPLFEHYRLVADKGQAPERIDKFISTHIEGTSRHRVQLAIKAGYVFLNGTPAKANAIIRPDDEIKVMMPYQRRGVEILPEDIPLDKLMILQAMQGGQIDYNQIYMYKIIGNMLDDDDDKKKAADKKAETK